jgi:hypothetical protein
MKTFPVRHDLLWLDSSVGATTVNDRMNILWLVCGKAAASMFASESTAVEGGSICTWMARLLKDEMGAVLLPPGPVLRMSSIALTPGPSLSRLASVDGPGAAAAALADSGKHLVGDHGRPMRQHCHRSKELQALGAPAR